MKLLSYVFTVIFSTSAFAVVKTGSCSLGSGESEVKVFLSIDSSLVQLSYEGSEDEKSDCQLVNDTRYDFNVLCKGDEDSENVSVLIKGTTGKMLDGEGQEIAKLKSCRIR